MSSTHLFRISTQSLNEDNNGRDYWVTRHEEFMFCSRVEAIAAVKSLRRKYLESHLGEWKKEMCRKIASLRKKLANIERQNAQATEKGLMFAVHPTCDLKSELEHMEQEKFDESRISWFQRRNFEFDQLEITGSLGEMEVIARPKKCIWTEPFPDSKLLRPSCCGQMTKAGEWTYCPYCGGRLKVKHETS